MELTVSPVGRGFVKTAARTAAQGGAPASKTKAGTAGGDRLELSRAALNWVETLSDRNYQEQEQKAALQQQKMEDFTDLSQQLEDADDTADAQSDSLRVMNRCMKIAANIMSGKRVPLKDLKYLMEHDSKMYQMAMAMKRPSKDDEKCDPVIRDEDEESPSDKTTAAGSDGTVSAPESSAGAEAPSASADGGEGAG